MKTLPLLLFFSAFLLGFVCGYSTFLYFDKNDRNISYLPSPIDDTLVNASVTDTNENIKDTVAPEVKGVDSLDENVDKKNDNGKTNISVTPTVAITNKPKNDSNSTSQSNKLIPPDITPATSQEINGFIERFSAQYNVDPNILRHIAVCESSFNPFAVNRNYAGLFQFAPNTWRSNRVEMGEDADVNLRFNAEEAVQTAAYMLSVGKRSIWPVC